MVLLVFLVFAGKVDVKVGFILVGMGSNKKHCPNCGAGIGCAHFQPLL